MALRRLKPGWYVLGALVLALVLRFGTVPLGASG